MHPPTVAEVQAVMRAAGYADAPLRAIDDPVEPPQVYVVSAPRTSAAETDRLLGGLAVALREAGWQIIPHLIKVDSIVLWAAMDVRAPADHPGGVRWAFGEEWPPSSALK